MTTAKQIAIELQEATDRMNKGYEQAQEIFADLNLGVSAFVAIPGEEAAKLHFRKTGNKWQLCIVDGQDPYPIAAASRRLRVAAAVALPDLLQALHAEAERQVHDVRGASILIDEFRNRNKGTP